MTRHIFKSILLGLLIGTALFMLPFFLLKFLLFFLIAGSIFRLVRGGRRRHGWRGGYQFAFADKIRNMSDEEYTSFKEKIQNRYHRHHYYYHHYDGCYNDGPKKTTNKNETGNNDQQESSL